MSRKDKTLAEWRETIVAEKSYVDKKPYSHNIISLSLNAISKNFGREEANKAIKDFGLTRLGWKQEKGAG